MGIVFKDSKFRKSVLRLLLPFLIQELIVVLTTLMSNIILGFANYPDYVTVGIAGAFQVFFLYNISAVSICYITNLFVSQHYGRGDLLEVKKDYFLVLKIVFVFSLIFFLITIIVPERLLFFITDEAARNAGAQYLKIFSITFLFIAPSMINYCLMKNIRLEKYSTFNSILTFTLVIIFELSFVLGTNLGVVGAAIGMVLARGIEFFICFFIVYKKSVIKLSFKEFFKLDNARFISMVKYGLPVFISKVSWVIGNIMITIITNKFPAQFATGAALLTAHSTLLTYENIMMCLSNGFSAVTGVLIGRELGANRLKKAEYHAQDISRCLFLMGMIEMSLFMLCLPIAMFSNSSIANNPEIINYLWKIFLIQAVIFLPRSYNASYCNGLFNAGGDTIYILLIDGITAWVSIVPLGYIGLHLNWDPLLIYGLIQLEEVIKCPINIIRYKQKKWIKNITNKKGIVFNE